MSVKDLQFIRNCMANDPVTFGKTSLEMLELVSVVIFPPQVKMWVQLLIPRIEDGNNFGVSIQVRHRCWRRELCSRDTDLLGSSESFHSWGPAAAVLGLV